MVITIGTIVKSSIMDEYYTYDGKGRCIEKKFVGNTGETIYTFLYDENEQLTGGIEKSESGETVVNIISYNDEGLFQQLETSSKMDSGSTIKRRYDLTWKDGNIIKYTYHFIEPAEDDLTEEVVYDNYPSPNTGMPIVIGLFGEPYQMCNKISKNNPIREDMELTYQNGRLVQSKGKDEITTYVYSDGTGKK